MASYLKNKMENKIKIKEIPIEYIETDDKVVSIRNSQSEEAIGRYMEKSESGTSKPICV